jgi:hypothetical protein
VNVYFEDLKKRKLRDRVLNADDHRKVTGANALFYLLFFITGFPLWIFGIITNYIPYKVPYVIAKKVAKNVEFEASVNGTIGVYFWQIYWLLQSLVVALVFRNWYVLGIFMLLVPASGIHAQAYWTYVKRFAGAIRWWKTSGSDKKNLLQARASLIRRFEDLKFED